MPMPYLNKASSVGSNFLPNCLTMTSVMENRKAPILSHTIPRMFPGIFSQALDSRSVIMGVFKLVKGLPKKSI